jgi:hypothetical protein
MWPNILGGHASRYKNGFSVSSALVTGCATLLRNWNDEAEPRHAGRPLLAASRADLPTLFIAAMTLTAGGVLARVAVHMLSN